jgi:hypothetical protein
VLDGQTVGKIANRKRTEVTSEAGTRTLSSRRTSSRMPTRR